MDKSPKPEWIKAINTEVLGITACKPVRKHCFRDKREPKATTRQYAIFINGRRNLVFFKKIEVLLESSTCPTVSICFVLDGVCLVLIYGWLHLLVGINEACLKIALFPKVELWLSKLLFSSIKIYLLAKNVQPN